MSPLALGPDLSSILDFCGPPDNRLLVRVRELRVEGLEFPEALAKAREEFAL